MTNASKTDWNSVLITTVRIAIGWHFLYEGLIKLFAGNWSAQGYLLNTVGFTSSFFHWIASDPVLMKIVDLLNIYGLILIGLALFTGIFIRLAASSGALLLLLYYFAYPPFGITLLGYSDGNAFVVDKLLIEALVLLFFVFTRNRGYGVDRLISYFREKKRQALSTPPTGGNPETRREVIKNLVSISVLGALGAGAYSSRKRFDIDASTGATVKINQVALSELKGELPKGKIKNHEISRLVLGGNLLGGWAHARDLLYVGSLFKAYNTEKKIFETLMLAEQAGINTINIGFPSNPVIQKYKKLTGSKIKVISQVAGNMKDDNFDVINQAIDYGVDIIQIQGNWSDWMVRDQKPEMIGKMLDAIRSQGYTAGLASHTIDTLMVCEENGIIPDYYMKTMHHDRYWSAHPKENRVPFEVDGQLSTDHNKFHDNLFCLYPEKTVDFVQRTQVPVMGFKVLAAGAIPPEDGFKWAFENGADFICVGMFDFQLVNNINICLDTLAKLQNRQREWYG